MRSDSSARALSVERRTLQLICGIGVTLVTIGLLVTGFVLQSEEAGFSFEDLSLLPVFPAFALAGTILLVRRRSARVGWLLLAVALTATVFLFSSAYAGYGVRNDVRGAVFAAWVTSVTFFPQLALFVRVLILFPTGEVPSRRWRPVSIGTWVLAAVGGVAGAVGAELDFVQPAIDNPVGIAMLQPAVDVLAPLLFPTLMVLAVLSVSSLVSRFRVAQSDERQQIKWVLFAAGVFVSFVSLHEFVLDASATDLAWLDRSLSIASNLLGGVGIPAAVLVAVLKYRLYDIDVVINRSIVYVLLSAILVGIYVGLVFAFQGLLAPFTAESDLAIAASTLAVAALFRPARTTVQSFIDRRFYRRKVDAQKTLDGFAMSLRDEVDLQALSSELTRVVGETMQPSHVTVWLRSGVQI